MNNAVTVQNIHARLPMPQGLDDIDARQWRVLVESTFPNAKTAEAVVMALDYCKARKLDIFKRPVNIVPMWNSSLGREVETVWPGINEVQVTASRSGKYAGMDEPKWGADKTQNFKGTRKFKENGSWKEENIDLTITYPEWCSVTVYRIVEGQRCAFTEPVYWIEAYAHAGKTEAPNAMWAKRPRGQLLKVAKAFSLRAAFPEEGEYTAEEMEGKEIEAGGVVIDNKPDNKPYEVDAAKPISPFKTATLRNTFHRNVEESLDRSQSADEAHQIIKLNKEKLDAMRASGDERDQMSVDSIQNKYKVVLIRLKTPHDEETGEIVEDEDEAAKEREYDANVAAGLEPKPGYEASAVPAFIKNMK